MYLYSSAAVYGDARAEALITLEFIFHSFTFHMKVTRFYETLNTRKE
jgi:hypothetical protein